MSGAGPRFTERIANIMAEFPAYRHDDLLCLPASAFFALEQQAARVRARRVADTARATLIGYRAKDPNREIARLERGG